jgi:hypothetical protein
MPIKDPDRRREFQRSATARWRARHPERNRESQRKSDARRDPAARARQQHETYARHGEAYRTRARAKYAANPEPTRAANRASYTRHQVKRIAYARAYRKRKGEV